ncbi:MAG: beta-glucosidase [Anaerolineaceae bacterium]|nr:beta-glucosidase [Anaerolineaceae bacterium]
MVFPKDFLWGAATASYQIEGGGLTDGRGECIWHRFSHTPGNVVNGDTGDVACDHYHRYREDVALMKELGLKAYRFSTSWPRVLPNGIGQINRAGIDFYSRLVDELLEADIRPFITLYHWDLPQALQDKGGWENPDSVKWFGDYAGVMANALGDRITDWTTLNEPFVISFVGNFFGTHAPGKQDIKAAYLVAHHLMLAHGAAVPVIRQAVPNARVGITIDLGYFESPTDNEADVQAAYREDGFKNRWFLDAALKGQYPADIVALLGDILEDIDLAAVKSAAVPVDFLGINYYRRHLFVAGSDGLFSSKDVEPDGSEFTAMGWEIYPDGLRKLLVRVAEEYKPPVIYVTENGAAFDDPPPAQGVVNDPRRAAYLRDHFAAASQAIEQGVPLKGYFVWSLLDNFEWAEGYNKRFGIIYVDYATQKRTFKSSARYYQQLISEQLR